MLRLASANEHDTVEACVHAAYAKWIERLGRKPAPMLDDYRDLIAKRVVYVLPDEADNIRAVLVMWMRDNYVWVDNLAVWPELQGHGIGKILIDFAAQYAHELGLNELRLLTNVLMVENIAFYERRGFHELERIVTDKGHHVVVMQKSL